jgi:hypothetical protein
MFTRRRFLGGLAAASALWSLPARASIARAASLAALVQASRHVVYGASVDAFAQWEQVGPRKCIVTYSVFRVDHPLDGRAPRGSEVTIRTLGGTVGDLGQVFSGEAVVALHERAAVFLRDAGSPDVFSVTAMAQGYYPVAEDAKGVARLRAAFEAVMLVGETDAAMHRLHGCSLAEAETMIARELGARAR